MEDYALTSFDRYFGGLQDPRINRKKLYPLVEILFVMVNGSISGAESLRDFVLFGNSKLEFMRRYYPFKNGIPSKNTFARLFAVLDPEAFKQCFVGWVKSLQGLLSEVIAIDGKRLCNSGDETKGLPAIHMVSAFASGSRLVLAQQKVEDKSNEITAIPKLLSLLSLQGQIVTIDAMGTQKAIARQIIDQGGDYVLALKGNQGTLNEDVRLFLETELTQARTAAISSKYEECDKGHGRIENRVCVVSNDLAWLEQKEQWAGLKSVAMIEETREIKGKVSCERRFFISSLAADAKQISSAIRSHWSIENSLHWTLDVVFNEDQVRTRKDHAAENMAVVRHITLNMLNKAKQGLKDISLKALRKLAGWNEQILELVLRQNF